MNKITLFFTFAVLTSTLFSQQGTYKLKIKTLMGHEINPLRAPSNYINNNGDNLERTELWNNLPFSGVGASLTSLSNSKRHRMDLYSSYRSSFNKNSPIKSSILEGGARFFSQGKKGRKWSSKLMYRNYVKTGGEDQDNLIGAPLSYQRFILDNSFSFKMHKNWRMSLTPRSVFKFYKRSGYKQFRYMHHGLTTVFSYRYNLKNKAGCRLIIGAGQRNHLIQRNTANANTMTSQGNPEVFVVNGENENLNRMWRYYSAIIGSKVPLNKKMKFIMEAGYILRKDVLDEKLGYGQTQLDLGIQYNVKKWKLSGQLSHLGRNYATLSASGSQNKLRYDYLKARGNAVFVFSKHFSAFVQVGCTSRISNSDIRANKALRSYFIGEGTIGVNYTLQGKYHANKRIR